MICKSFSSEQKTAPLRDGFRTVQTRFYPLYLLDLAFEADLPGTRAKPSHEDADAVRDETTCQSATFFVISARRGKFLCWNRVRPWWTAVTGG